MPFLAFDGLKYHPLTALNNGKFHQSPLGVFSNSVPFYFLCYNFEFRREPTFDFGRPADYPAFFFFSNQFSNSLLQPTRGAVHPLKSLGWHTPQP